MGLVRFGPNGVWRENLPRLYGDVVGLGVAGVLVIVRNYWVHLAGIAIGLVSLLAFVSAIQFT